MYFLFFEETWPFIFFMRNRAFTEKNEGIYKDVQKDNKRSPNKIKAYTFRALLTLSKTCLSNNRLMEGQLHSH